MAGTDTGRLLLFESGELRNELHVTGTASPAIKYVLTIPYRNNFFSHQIFYANPLQRFIFVT